MSGFKRTIGACAPACNGQDSRCQHVIIGGRFGLRLALGCGVFWLNTLPVRAAAQVLPPTTIQIAAEGPRSSLGEALFRQKSDDSRFEAMPMVARFQSDDGATFVLDRSQGPTLLRFDTSREVWVLSPRRAGRGDLIYLDDAGRPVLRATKLGGMTVFTSETPGGSAAALAGRGTPIKALGPLTPAGLLQKLTLASAKASRAAQKLVTFDAEDVSNDTAPLFADSALIAAEAFVQLVRQAEGRSKAMRIDRVLLVRGEFSNAQRQGGQIRITIAPDSGIAGRPSSERIARTIAR